MNTTDLKIVIVIAILFALFDKMWFNIRVPSEIYNNTVKLIQGSEINADGKYHYAVLAYIVMALVYYNLVYDDLDTDNFHKKSIYYSLGIWGVFNLTNIVIFNNYTVEMLFIDTSWGIFVTQIIGLILKNTKNKWLK
jgi:hypothetical protein